MKNEKMVQNATAADKSEYDNKLCCIPYKKRDRAKQ